MTLLRDSSRARRECPHTLRKPRDPFVVMHLPADEARELQEWRRERAMIRGAEAA